MCWLTVTVTSALYLFGSAHQSINESIELMVLCRLTIVLCTSKTTGWTHTLICLVRGVQQASPIPRMALLNLTTDLCTWANRSVSLFSPCRTETCATKAKHCWSTVPSLTPSKCKAEYHWSLDAEITHHSAIFLDCALRSVFMSISTIKYLDKPWTGRHKSVHLPCYLVASLSIIRQLFFAYSSQHCVEDHVCPCRAHSNSTWQSISISWQHSCSSALVGNFNTCTHRRHEVLQLVHKHIWQKKMEAPSFKAHIFAIWHLWARHCSIIWLGRPASWFEWQIPKLAEGSWKDHWSGPGMSHGKETEPPPKFWESLHQKIWLEADWKLNSSETSNICLICNSGWPALACDSHCVILKHCCSAIIGKFQLDQSLALLARLQRLPWVSRLLTH